MLERDGECDRSVGKKLEGSHGEGILSKDGDMTSAGGLISGAIVGCSDW